MSKISQAILMAIMAMGDFSMVSNEKCSVNEITEKTDVTEKEILMLINKEIIRDENMYGASYIIGDTPYSVEAKLKEYRESLKRR